MEMARQVDGVQDKLMKSWAETVPGTPSSSLNF